MKEKLLFMGVDSSTKYALEYTKILENVETIITDYNSLENSKIKQKADEAWQIDVKDLDLLEKRCREKGITGIYAGNHEFCLDQTKKLAECLGLPFYATDEGWACAQDKIRFKEHCIAVGLDVPRQYSLKKPFQKEVLATVCYPVIVKPVDACAQKGFAICRNEEELLRAYNGALEYSPTGNILVEEYIEGDEVACYYFMDHGKVTFMGICDDYEMMINDRPNFSLILSPSRYYQEYLESTNDKVVKLFEHMDCQNGAGYVQGLRKDGKYYFIELNYRIDGIGDWLINKYLYNYSSVEAMVNFALGKKHPIDWNKLNLSPGEKRGAVYFYWAKPGKVNRIIGIEHIKAMDQVQVVVERFKEGDEIVQTDNMLQIAYYISLWADNEEQLIVKLKEINNTLQILDDNGNKLLIPFERYDLKKIRCPNN